MMLKEYINKQFTDLLMGATLLFILTVFSFCFGWFLSGQDGGTTKGSINHFLKTIMVALRPEIVDQWAIGMALGLTLGLPFVNENMNTTKYKHTRFTVENAKSRRIGLNKIRLFATFTTTIQFLSGLYIVLYLIQIGVEGFYSTYLPGAINVNNLRGLITSSLLLWIFLQVNEAVDLQERLRSDNLAAIQERG
ncbi:hypothetical protein [Corynebacterium parakroppenstedtii]|uniref:hypothetical protein n=1 Tax=Corynebacterium parakroppenstedtii TaxID=2828363 RepID=UPI001C8EBE2E|nr:hypothetical protein [Corynebacterium parakroppenstedtii]MBY0788619.1 hypothetical protein [Corynebacterium parakroppenstedtii]